MAESLKGQVQHITFYNPDNGYTIARVAVEADEGGDSGAGVSVVGNMAGVSEGETVELAGTWVTHPKYGRQFKVESYTHWIHMFESIRHKYYRQLVRRLIHRQPIYNVYSDMFDRSH